MLAGEYLSSSKTCEDFDSMSARTFWGEFEHNADKWAGWFNSGGQQKVFAAIDQTLEMNGFDFCFDITADDKTCILAFSPEGDEGEAVAIDTLVKCAPPISGWRVVSRRQRKHVDDVRSILRHLYNIDLFECRFRSYDGSLPGVIEIFIPADSDLTSEERRGFGDAFLWHALGEGFSMRHRIKALVRTGIPDDQVTLGLGAFVRRVIGGESNSG